MRRRMLFSVLAVLFGFAFTYHLIHTIWISAGQSGTTFECKSVRHRNQMLSTTEHGYVLPFEVVSILLLAAMIGCIVIAMKSKTRQREN